MGKRLRKHWKLGVGFAGGALLVLGGSVLGFVACQQVTKAKEREFEKLHRELYPRGYVGPPTEV